MDIKAARWNICRENFIAKTRKQREYPSTDKWIKKM